MKIIDGNIYISTQEYAEAAKISSESIIKYIHASRRLYANIESIYETTEQGRISLYKLDSLCAEHREKVIQHFVQPEMYVKVPRFVVELPEEYKFYVEKRLPLADAQGYTRKSAWLRYLTFAKPQFVRTEFGLSKGTLLEMALKHIQAENNRVFAVGSLQYLKTLMVRYGSVYQPDSFESVYQVVVNGRVGLQNARKVKDEVAILLKAAYLNKGGAGKTTPKDVLNQYNKWRNGVGTPPVDRKTGELVVDEQVLRTLPELCERTIQGYFTKWDVWGGIVRNSKKAHNDSYKPHAHRHAPEYSLSKITMDDMAGMFSYHQKGKKSPARAMSYKVFDVKTGAIIGDTLFPGKATQGDVFDALRDMYQFLYVYGLPQPAELETERHLITDEVIKKLKLLFSFVTVYVNQPQSKHAEGHIKEYKNQDCVRLTEGYVGRYKSRNERQQRNPDKALKVYEYPEIIQLNEIHNTEWNKGKIDQAVSLANPNLSPIDWQMVAEVLGETSELKINRSDYLILTVDGEERKYQIPEETLIKLQKGKRVRVRYLDFLLEQKVWIYNYEDIDAPDADVLIGEAKRLKTFNTAQVEWTEADRKALGKQRKRIRRFEDFVEEAQSELPELAVEADAELILVQKYNKHHQADAEDAITLDVATSQEKRLRRLA